MKKLISYISSFILVLILFSFSINSDGPSDNAKLNVSVSETCAAGTCAEDLGNVCERYSEWELDSCNETAIIPCED